MSTGIDLTVKSPDSSQDGIGLKSVAFTKCSDQFFCAEHGPMAHYVPSHLEKILLSNNNNKKKINNHFCCCFNAAFVILKQIPK